MSQFQNLPDEIILKVLGHLKVKDLLICGQLSKRIRAISRVSVQGVESLWGVCRFIPADWGS